MNIFVFILHPSSFCLLKRSNFIATHVIRFEPSGKTIQATTGALLSDVAREAGLDLNMPCGGQGRCGRCAVIANPLPVTEQASSNLPARLQPPSNLPPRSRGGIKGGVGIRRRSTLRLSPDDLAAGYALACQAVVEGDALITVPPQEKIERRLVSDKTAAGPTIPFAYMPDRHQTIRPFPLTIEPPSMADQTDDWSRLKRALAAAHNISNLTADLPTLRCLGPALRENNWSITAIVEQNTWDNPHGPPRLVDILKDEDGRACSELAEGMKDESQDEKIHPSSFILHPLIYGVAVDIGTTTVSLYLANLETGEVVTKAAEYNGQIKRGEDVISRIIYAGKNNGLAELQALVRDTINTLLERAIRRAKIKATDIYKMTVAGNSTMIHLFLGLPPGSIRLDPFVTAINQPPPARAAELEMNIHPQANVDCLPGVASYVGADISAGVVGSQMCAAAGDEEAREGVTLFLDVGTNGEMVLGDCGWLISCACSAGPAFEGAGVQHGMRATTGAIEEVWINSQTWEPSYRVIPNPKLELKGQPTPPRGLCGSGLISLLAEMFITGVIDKSGNISPLPNPLVKKPLRVPLGGGTRTSPPAGGIEGGRGARIRRGPHGPEYVIAWADETEGEDDIVITEVDIDNLMRAKGAIYAGFTVLAESVGIDLTSVERFLIGGAFGQYINVEKAIQIGLLPDLPWDKFQFLGNTALQGALLALLNTGYRRQITEVAANMTYLELSADNSFYDQFTSALFLPHTDVEKFPSVAAVVGGK